MSDNKMPGLLAAKRALLGGTSVVMATGYGHHPMSSFRITQIRREESTYYGKCLEDGRWYPISSIEVQS